MKVDPIHLRVPSLHRQKLRQPVSSSKLKFNIIFFLGFRFPPCRVIFSIISSTKYYTADDNSEDHDWGFTKGLPYTDYVPTYIRECRTHSTKQYERYVFKGFCCIIFCVLLCKIETSVASHSTQQNHYFM